MSTNAITAASLPSMLTEHPMNWASDYALFIHIWRQVAIPVVAFESSLRACRGSKKTPK